MSVNFFKRHAPTFIALLLTASFALGGGPVVGGGGEATISTSAPLSGTGSAASPVTCTSASISSGGCLTTGTQSTAGFKTFTSGAGVSSLQNFCLDGSTCLDLITRPNASGGLNFQSDISAARASTTIGAFQFNAANSLDADDLVMDVKNGTAGTTVFKVDNEGDATATATLTATSLIGTASVGAAVSIGNYFSLSGLANAGSNWRASSSCDMIFGVGGNNVTEFNGGACGNSQIALSTNATWTIQSNTADATTSSTVGAITLKAGANITSTDLLLDVQDSVGAHAFKLTEFGDVTIPNLAGYYFTGDGATATGMTWESVGSNLEFYTNGSRRGFFANGGGFTATSTVTATIFNGSLTTNSTQLISARTAASTTSTSPAVEIGGNVTLDANDLVLGILAGGVGDVAGFDKEGDLVGAIQGTTTFTIQSYTTDATTSSTVGAITLKASNDITNTDLLLDLQNSAAGHAATLTEAGMFRSITPMTLSSVFIGAVTVALTNYGGDVLPAYAFTVDQVTLRISTAGSGGTTNWVFRVSDGTNTCDCTRACNGATGNVALTCAGTAGSGCAFPASANLTYSVNSIGNCSTGPTVVGNAQVRGYWTP